MAEAGPKSTEPYAVVPADGGIFAYAGLWERWRSPADGTIVRSFTIVTTDANDSCRPIHDRMPVILPPSAWSLWLGETETTQESLLGLLRSCPTAAIRVYRVSPAVGNVKNDDAGLLAPAGGPPEPEHGVSLARSLIHSGADTHTNRSSPRKRGPIPQHFES